MGEKTQWPDGSTGAGQGMFEQSGMTAMARSLHPDVAGHDFLGRHHDRHALRTGAVLVLCLATMALEIGGGVLLGSMALLADGLHMATHAGVMLVAAGAYLFARSRAGDPSYSFGTGKVGDLAGFASAIMLAATALVMGVESVQRLFTPVPVAFAEAIPIAVVGLLVNIVSVWLLHDEHHHGAPEHDDDHGHDDHDHDHAHHHHDHNYRAAYFHVLADLAVGILAIGGLVAGRTTGWLWLDPVIGLVGAYVVLCWSITLLRASGGVLLDRVPDPSLARAVRERLACSGAEVVDFHLWRLGPGHHGVIARLVAARPQPLAAYHALLLPFPTLSHVTLEVEPRAEPAE